MPTLLFCACGTDGTDPGTGGPPDGLTAIKLDFCLKESGFNGFERGMPSFLAYRNDGEAWTPVSPDAKGSFAFKAAAKVAITFIQGETTQTVYASAEDLKAISGLGCKQQGHKSLSGSVANLGAGAIAVVTGGDAGASGSGSFTLDGVPDGPLDLLAIRYQNINYQSVPTDAIIRRDVSLSSGASVPAFDFSSAAAVPLVSTALTVSGSRPDDFSEAFLIFRTANGTFHNFGYSGDIRSAPGLPTSLLRDGDLHTLYFSARGADFTVNRGAILYYQQPSNKNIVLGPALNAVSFTKLTTTPYMRIRATVQSQPEYSKVIQFFFEQPTSTGGGRNWCITATAGYFGGSAPATWEVEVPDLSGVPGFPAIAGLEASQRTVAAGKAWSDMVGNWIEMWIGRPPRNGDVAQFATSPTIIIPKQ